MEIDKSHTIDHWVCEIRVPEDVKIPYRMELTPDSEERGVAASFPNLRGCLSMEDTVEEAYVNAMDEKSAWLKAAIEDNIDIPEPDNPDAYSRLKTKKTDIIQAKGRRRK